MLRIGIAGCGRAARIHLGRLLARQEVKIVGLADVDLAAARALGDLVPSDDGPVPIFNDHKELLTRVAPDALGVFAPHRAHYRVAMDALQAGCHVFIEKPLSTNAQEAVDIVGLAKGRNRIVAVGHQYRLRPSLIEARLQIQAGVIGNVRLVHASLSAGWLARHQEKADAWRLDPKLSGGGILADAGDHLLDALLWTTGQFAVEVAAFQDRLAPGLDVVTAATIRLSGETTATMGISGVCSESWFELTFFGETGRLTATDSTLDLITKNSGKISPTLPEPSETIDGDFVRAVETNTPPCCPAEEAVATVRLMEAITRSATSGQFIRLA